MGLRAGMDWCGKSGPPGFDPRTVQLVGSRYTGYATLPTNFVVFMHYSFETSTCTNRGPTGALETVYD